MSECARSKPNPPPTAEAFAADLARAALHGEPTAAPATQLEARRPETV
jgi:hypothetical protein